jgi:hypothetical protein
VSSNFIKAEYRSQNILKNASSCNMFENATDMSADVA